METILVWIMVIMTPVSATTVIGDVAETVGFGSRWYFEQRRDCEKYTGTRIALPKLGEVAVCLPFWLEEEH